MFNLIKDNKNYFFTIFINNYSTLAINYNILFIFLYIEYFLRYIFSLIYLLEIKTHLFSTSINLLDFSKSTFKLTLSSKYYNKIFN